MLYCYIYPVLFLFQLITFSLQDSIVTPVVEKENNDNKQTTPARYSASGSSPDQVAINSMAAGLEPRYISDRSIIKNIVDRLHELDADIGRLLYNSTSMYAPDDQSIAFQENIPKGGEEKFSEVLADLDALQDEIGVVVSNATKTHQYNILVRLRPLTTILYRIRHNLHLMRNSLVAINTVASLEKLGNNVLDSTLQAFMRPDANASEEFEDSGNYDINLDKPDNKEKAIVATAKPSTTTTTTTTSTTTTTTTTTPTPTTTPAIVTTTEKPASTRKASRPINRRQKSTTTSTSKPIASQSDLNARRGH